MWLNSWWWLVLCQLQLCRSVHRTDSRNPALASRQETEQILRGNAYWRCRSMAEYTTLAPHLFSDQRGARGNEDHILTGFESGLNVSRVVQAYVSSRAWRLHHNLPVTLTATNIGLGRGLTNGTELAKKLAEEKIDRIFFPTHHPRQNMTFCMEMGKLAELGISSFYQHHMKSDNQLSYVTILHHVAVHKDGVVGLECGWLQPRNSCSMRFPDPYEGWREDLFPVIHMDPAVWQSVESINASLVKKVPIYDEVFVLNAAWDFNYHHFIADCLVRLARFYHFLLRNPQVKLHLRLEENDFNYSDPESDPDLAKRSANGKWMRHRVFTLLDISPERVVTGPILARKVYLPNDVECSSFPKRALDLQLLSRILQRRGRKVVKTGVCVGRDARDLNSVASRKLLDFAPPQRDFDRDYPRKYALTSPGVKLFIQWRPCGNNVTNMATRASYRDWRCTTSSQLEQLVFTAEQEFPRSTVRIANTTATPSMACDIVNYQQADVVVGMHGAAMTNAMFMRPGTLLVEIVGEYDARVPPVCGFYGPFSAVFGVHHYIYYYDGVKDADALDVHDLFKRVHAFYHGIRENVPYKTYSPEPFS